LKVKGRGRAKGEEMAGGERREEKIQRREKVGIEDITRSRRLKYDKPNPGGSNDHCDLERRDVRCHFF